jgi:hypothetical protein
VKTIKYGFGVLFLIIGLLPFQITYATSGACSWHGGVNCSAGASADGNSMCNDGFESSVSYYSMVECSGSNSCGGLTVSQRLAYPTYSPSYKKIERELISSELTTTQQQLQNYQNDINNQYQMAVAQNQALNNTYNSQLQSEQQQALDVAKATNAQLNPYGGQNSDASNYSNSITNSYNSLYNQYNSNASIAQQQLATYQNSALNSTYVRNAKSCIDQLSSDLEYMNSAPNDYCSSINSELVASSTNPDSCECPNNESWSSKSNSCISRTQYCQEKYDPISYDVNNTCTCPSGYQWNGTFTKCININPVTMVTSNISTLVTTPIIKTPSRLTISPTKNKQDPTLKDTLETYYSSSTMRKSDLFTQPENYMATTTTESSKSDTVQKSILQKFFDLLKSLF